MHATKNTENKQENNWITDPAIIFEVEAFPHNGLLPSAPNIHSFGVETVVGFFAVYWTVVQKHNEAIFSLGIRADNLGNLSGVLFK